MKRELWAILALITGCSGAGQTRSSPNQCTIKPNSDAGYVMECEDGTTSTIDHAPSCQLESSETSEGRKVATILCPPEFEPVTIVEGPKGPDGESCTIRPIEGAPTVKALECGGRLILIGTGDGPTS